MEKIKLGKYRHYKGNLYNVIGTAKHSETLDDYVIYEALYDNKVSKVWIRPLTMFTEKIKVDDKLIDRFEFVG